MRAGRGYVVMMRSPIWTHRERRNQITPECRQEIDRLNSMSDELLTAYVDIVKAASLAPEFASTLMAHLTEAEARWLLGHAIGYDAGLQES